MRALLDASKETGLNVNTLNVTVECLTLMLHIREVPGSDHGLETSCPG
jgi:hypothetical protein